MMDNIRSIYVLREHKSTRRVGGLKTQKIVWSCHQHTIVRARGQYNSSREKEGRIIITLSETKAKNGCDTDKLNHASGACLGPYNALWSLQTWPEYEEALEELSCIHLQKDQFKKVFLTSIWEGIQPWIEATARRQTVVIFRRDLFHTLACSLWPRVVACSVPVIHQSES